MCVCVYLSIYLSVDGPIDLSIYVSKNTYYLHIGIYTHTQIRRGLTAKPRALAWGFELTSGFGYGHTGLPCLLMPAAVEDHHGSRLDATALLVELVLQVQRLQYLSKQCPFLTNTSH